MAGFAVLLPALAMMAGCVAEGMTPNSFMPNKGFVDPSEVAVTVNRGPLLVPILDKLNTGIDEPAQEFANATDVRPDDLVVIPSDYTIGKADLISVSIADLQQIGAETVKTTRV